MATTLERVPLTKEQFKSLQAYIIRKRKKQDEAQSSAKKLHTPASEDDSNSVASNDSSEEEQQSESAPDIAEQLKTLREKLESLKKEKHHLFQELKKVLHEEEEKKRLQFERQREQEHQNVMLSSDIYRNDPRMNQPGGIKPSWIPDVNKQLSHSGSLQDLHRYSLSHSSHVPHQQGFIHHGAIRPGITRLHQGGVTPDARSKDIHSYTPSFTGHPTHYSGMSGYHQYRGTPSAVGSTSQYVLQYQKGVNSIQPPLSQIPHDLSSQPHLYTSPNAFPEMMMHHEYSAYSFDPRHHQRFLMPPLRHSMPSIKGSSIQYHSQEPKHK